MRSRELSARPSLAARSPATVKRGFVKMLNVCLLPSLVPRLRACASKADSRMDAVNAGRSVRDMHMRTCRAHVRSLHLPGASLVPV
jgi:hypothetical protein